MPDTSPTPSTPETPLRSRLPAACEPGDAHLRDLTTKRMVLIRGGDGVSAEGGGLGGSIPDNRYFLIVLDKTYEEVPTEATQLLSLRGKSIEVFLDGGKLNLDISRSIHSRTESTTFRLPLSLHSPNPSTLALVEEGHEKVWAYTFMEIFATTSPMNTMSNAEDLAYHAATGRLRTLEDSIAVQVAQTKLVSPLWDPKPMQYLLTDAKVSLTTDLMNLDAQRGKYIAQIALNNALIPGVGVKPFTVYQLPKVEAKLKEIFSLKGSFTPTTTRLNVGDSGVPIPNRNSTIYDETGRNRISSGRTSTGQEATRRLNTWLPEYRRDSKAEVVSTFEVVFFDKNPGARFGMSSPYEYGGGFLGIRPYKGEFTGARSVDPERIMAMFGSALPNTGTSNFQFVMDMDSASRLYQKSPGAADPLLPLLDLGADESSTESGAVNLSTTAGISSGVEAHYRTEAEQRMFEEEQRRGITAGYSGNLNLPKLRTKLKGLEDTARDLFLGKTKNSQNTWARVLTELQITKQDITLALKTAKGIGVKSLGADYSQLTRLHKAALRGDSPGVHNASPSFSPEMRRIFNTIQNRERLHNEITSLESQLFTSSAGPGLIKTRKKQGTNTGNAQIPETVGVSNKTFSLNSSTEEYIPSVIEPIRTLFPETWERRLKVSKAYLEETLKQEKEESTSYANYAEDVERQVFQHLQTAIDYVSLDEGVPGHVDIARFRRKLQPLLQFTPRYPTGEVTEEQLEALIASAFNQFSIAVDKKVRSFPVTRPTPGTVVVKNYTPYSRFEPVSVRIPGSTAVSYLVESPTLKIEDLTARLTKARTELTQLQKIKLPETIRIGGMDIDTSTIRGKGSTEDAESEISRERTRKYGVRRPTTFGSEGQMFEGTPVTLEKALQLKNPGLVVYGSNGRQSLAEWFHSNTEAKIDEDNVAVRIWKNIATPEDKIESPGTITVSSRLFPGLGRTSGTTTISTELYSSIFTIPQAEGSFIEGKKALQERGMGFGTLETKHPLFALQQAMEKVPDLKQLMDRGKTTPTDFNRFLLNVSFKFPEQRDAIRNVLRIRSQVEQTHLGGASLDPLQFLARGRSAKGSAEGQIRMRFYGEDFEKLKEEGNFPVLADVIDWSLKGTGRIPGQGRSPEDMMRKLVDNFVKSGNWKSGSLQANSDNKVTFGKEGEEGEASVLDTHHSVSGTIPVDEIAMVEDRIVAEELAKAKVPIGPANRSFLSVRDFFGKINQYSGDSTGSIDSTIQRALDALQNTTSDLLPNRLRSGSFFGYSFDPSKGAQSVRPITAAEYSTPGVRKITPSRAAFDMIAGLSPNEQGAFARQIGLALPDNLAARQPYPPGTSRDPGYWKFLEQGEGEGEREGWIGDAHDVALSPNQYQILKHVFRKPILDDLVLDKDTPAHIKEVERFLKNPSKTLSPLTSTSHLSPTEAVEPMVSPNAMTAQDMTMALEGVKQQGISVSLTEGNREVPIELNDDGTVTAEGVRRPMDSFMSVPSNSVDQTGERVYKHITAATEPIQFNDVTFANSIERQAQTVGRRQNPGNLVSLKQMTAGNRSIVLSPQLNDSPIGSSEVLSRFLDNVSKGGAKVVGFDIETAVQWTKDEEGNFVKNSQGKRRKETAGLRNVGAKTFTIGTDGQVQQDEAFDVATEQFRRLRTSGAILASEASEYGEGDEQKMISAAYQHLSAQSEDTFFTAFNARFDVNTMADKARTARDLTKELLESSESRYNQQNERLRAELAHFQEAYHFFAEVMPGRTIEASHLFEVSGVERTKDTLESFLHALGIIKGKQKHAALWDVEKMGEGISKALSGFLQGDTARLEDVIGKYVFPYNADGGELKENGKTVVDAQGRIKHRRAKDNFLLTGVEQESSDYDSRVTLFGRKIDTAGNPIGPIRDMISYPRGSALQHALTQGYAYGGLTLSDSGADTENWRKSLDDNNLRDLIERDVRRALNYETTDKKKRAADIDRRNEYIVRGNIAKEYNATAEHEKQQYIHDIASALVPDASGTIRPRRKEFGLLYRADGTVDTSTAQSVIPFINTDTSKRISDWVKSPDMLGDNPGFLSPIGRQAVIRAGEILQNREQDKLFNMLVHEPATRGLISAEEAQVASRAYQSWRESRYTNTGREIEGPTTATIKTVSNGFGAVTRLSGDMSHDQVYDALFEHALDITHSVQKNINTLTPEIGPPALKTPVPEEVTNTMTNRLLQSVRAAAPELSGIGAVQRPTSLWDLAGEVQSALASSTRKTKVRDDLDTGMPLKRDGSSETEEGLLKTLSTDVRMELPQTEEELTEFTKDGAGPRSFIHALTSSVQGKGGFFATDGYAASLPIMRKKDLNPTIVEPLREKMRGLSQDPIPAFNVLRPSPNAGDTQGLDPQIDRTASLIQKAVQEEAEEEVKKAFSSLGENIESDVLKTKIGAGVAALAGLALVGDIGDRFAEREDQKNKKLIDEPPRSTTEHNAGPLDQELSQEGSSSRSAAIHGWEKLSIQIDIEHPGFPGSAERYDDNALAAFSNDISSTLEKHFSGSTPTRSSSSNKQQTNGLKWKASSILSRANNRYGNATLTSN